MAKTLVIGASEKPDRYSNKAVNMLVQHNHSVEAIGIKSGSIGKIEIKTGKPLLKEIDTVTLYVNPTNQAEWQDYIISLEPKRVIFNPGTENQQFEDLLKTKNIEPIEACTLVMLSTGQY